MADSVITVSGVTVTPGAAQNVVRWSAAVADCLSYHAVQLFEVWSSATASFGAATKVGETADLSFTHTGLLVGLARWYWVRAKDNSNNFSDYSPLTTVAGVPGTPTSTGADSVGSTEIADGAVIDRHVASGINGNKLSAGSLPGNRIASKGVGTGQLADNSVNPIYAATPGPTTFVGSSSYVPLKSVSVPVTGFIASIAGYLHFGGSGTGNNGAQHEVALLVTFAGVDEVLGDRIMWTKLTGSETHRFFLSANFSGPAGTYTFKLAIRSGVFTTMTTFDASLGVMVPLK